MERTQLFDLMGELKLYGMKAAFDEIMAIAVKEHARRLATAIAKAAWLMPQRPAARTRRLDGEASGSA
jgi:hypothetical protein